MKKVDIKLQVELDDNNVPSSIVWSSDDPPSNGQEADAKAFFLSIFDKKNLETLKIDLWNTEFEVGEMNRMTYYTLKGMADTFYRATNNNEMANDIARFAQYFGEELGIVKKEQPPANPPAETK